MESLTIWHLPIKTASESNSNEHWAIKARRHRLQKKRIFQEFLVNPPSVISFPCQVILTRIAPRKLDKDDNLPTSFKYIKDAIAESLTGIKQAGRADDDDRISWTFKQEKGNPKEYAIKVEMSMPLE